MSILLYLEYEVFYICQLDLVDSVIQFSYVLTKFFFLLGLLVTNRQILNSLTIHLFFTCNSISFCLLYYDALLLGAYMLRIVMFLGELTSSSFCNGPFYP